MTSPSTLTASILACGCMCALSGPAIAQEVDLSGKFAVELNSVQSAEGACSLTFMITNGLEADIEQAVFETVLFSTSGQVERLTLFDFGALPVNRPRVRQFAVPGLACDSLGRILFNGATACTGEGISEGVCETNLMPMTRTDVEVLG